MFCIEETETVSLPKVSTRLFAENSVYAGSVSDFQKN